MQYLGELTALGTATCWSIGTIVFGIASRRFGSFTVNTIRIPLAALILLVALIITRGQVIPEGATIEQILLLALSGVIGLVLGDTCYYQSIVILGTRLGSLVSSSAPVFAVIISWIFLDQLLSIAALLGIAITLGGIAWVIIERNPNDGNIKRRSKVAGVLFGFSSGLCLALGLVIAKIAMAENIDPMSASLVRMAAGAIIIWVVVIVTRRVGKSIAAIRNRRSFLMMSGASFIGPFLGIWLSLVAIQYTKIGIASTLMALVPVIVIPLAIIVHKERPSLRAIIGTLVAVSGVAIIFLR